MPNSGLHQCIRTFVLCCQTSKCLTCQWISRPTFLQMSSESAGSLVSWVIFVCTATAWSNEILSCCRESMQGFCAIITGSIACSANLPVFSLLRGRFWGFSPRRGDTLHRWGWNFARLLHAKFHLHRCNDNGVGPPKLKFLLRFDQNVEYKSPAGAYPLRDFHKICRVCTSFQDALGVKTWLDLLKGLWSYGGFKLRGSGFPQIFSAP